MTNILNIEASARHEGSVSRQLTSQIIEKLQAKHPNATVTTRDLAKGVSLLDGMTLGGFWTPADQRSSELQSAIAESDTLVAELKAADAIVIGMPIYNFGVPAAFKAWIDLIARAGETFQYSDQGPVGLLEDRPVYVAVASGGTTIGSEADFTTSYIKFVLAFLGIKNVTFFDASGAAFDEKAALERASAQIAALN
ncbi:MAG: NAD(P)H-dependent oxidoreductase [Chloroflexota bacterium]